MATALRAVAPGRTRAGREASRSHAAANWRTSRSRAAGPQGQQQVKHSPGLDGAELGSVAGGGELAGLI